MKKLFNKKRLYYYIYLMSSLLTIFNFVACIAILIAEGFKWYVYLLMIGFIIFLVSTLTFKQLIKYSNKQINNLPRMGHQGEPGSWQCSCGHYNGAYRHICVSCGKVKD